jgi:uncharacterized repeat protein (TIGR01451 family)
VIVTASTPGDLSAIGMTITNTAGVTDALDATPENNFAERAITLREVDEGKIVVRNIVSGTAPSSGTFAYALQTPGDALPFTLHAGGSITFTGMASGAYGLSATAAMGYSASIECAGNGNGTFTLEAGATVTCTFTHAGTNVIAGTLWHDRNENQQIDADEWRLPHVTIGLSGTLDGGSVSAITTTDSSGVYQFTGLPDGAHGVTVMSETLPSGVITPAYDADGIDTPNIAQTALCCNTPATLNFGYRGDGQVGGRVFYDVNNDGMLDAGDLSLANIVVHLSGDLNNDSTLDVLTATTNSAGSYAFTSILTGVYTLTIDAATLPRVLLPTTSASTVVTLSDTPQLDVNFGYRGTGSIAGFVWEDVNGNGVPDAGEPGLNTSLTLEGDLNRDGVIDARTTKSAGGNYAFDGLAGGIYTITVDQASLLPAMQPIAQTGRVETLAHSESKSGADFGFARPASVQGRIWLDANRNGVMDDGEDGVSGIAISLFDASAASNAITSQSISASPIATITSNDGGEYGFDDLVPGRPYSLHFALPAGFAWVVGNSSAIDGYGNTGVFTVTSGENVVLRMNAGATQPTRLTLHKKTAQTIIGLDERITYTLVIRNAGDTMAAQTTISDPLPGELQFISAEPWPSMPPAEGAPLVWAIGDLPAGQTFTITLMTQLKTEPAPAGNALVNTAYVLADMQTVARTNDLQSSATTVLRPSAITLASFEAMMTGNGVQLAWRTSLEQNTFGFFVLRSATGNRTDALGVNAEIVPAGAGDYALIDADGLISSVYWLQEVELDGSTRDAGPFRVIAPASAAPAPATAMQLAVMMQPQPAMVAVASSQLSAPNVVLEEIEPQQTWVQPQVIAPVEPSHPSTPQRSDDEPISTKADAIDETDVPALVPASIGSAQIQSTATATPESEPVMDVRGIAQAVSVQRGNPTPSDTAIQNDTTSDTELPVEALMLLAGIGLTGVLLLLMMFAGRFARKQQPRK